VLDPSATWALRRLAAWLEAEPHGFPLHRSHWPKSWAWAATSVGTAPPCVALARLVLFKMARVNYDDHLAVRVVLPPPPPGLIAQLPERLAMQHPTHACRTVAGTGQ
jgi:hypothetical protein